ncbi:MAG: mucoidy inhibitor MuiA family protein [Alistipes sp.]|nr:mucoidy inhibitor MuiA family protein [Alistipes sp.]
MKRLTLLLWCLCAAVSAVCGAETNKVTTRAEKVTLFTSGAQVTRSGAVSLPAGVSTVIFTGLSPYLDEKSLQVAGRGDFTVTAVERRCNYADSAAWTVRKREIESACQDIARESSELAAAQEVVDAEIEMLRTNCSVAGRTEATSLAAIRELTEYYASRLEKLKARSREITHKQQTLKERRAALDDRMRQLGGRPKSPASEVVVRVDARKACLASFTLNYYVKGAGWYPTYDIRSDGLASPVTVAYRANVYQNTREDWTDVALTLSSSNPSTGSVVPVLTPYRLDYGVAAPRYDDRTDGSEVSGVVVAASDGEPLTGVTVQVPGTTVGTATDVDGRFSITMPGRADRLRFSYVGMKSKTLRADAGSTLAVRLEEDATQLDEVVVTAYGSARKAAVTGKVGTSFDFAEFDEETAVEANSMSHDVERRQTAMGYEFEIRRPYTIPSDGKSVAAEIGLYTLPATYLYECSPRADRDAFLTAAVTGWERLNLLDGEASVYFENMFVGKSILSTDVQSDTLSFSMGRDRGIVVQRTRENYYRSRRTIGSSQTQEVAWRISVRNARAESVALKLCDQIPVSTNDAITVAVDELSGGRADASGIVTWDIELAPGEQRDVVLRYKVRSPKNRTLTVE